MGSELYNILSANIEKENDKLKTTISKQRIYDDIILRKVCLSTNSLNVIDKKINYYFTNQKEQIWKIGEPIRFS